MKRLKVLLPIIIVILFELAVGILLLVKPLEFTEWVLRIFGAVLLVVSIFYIVRFIIAKVKREEASIIPVIISVITLGVGIFCTFFPQALIAAVGTAIAVIYGLIMIISGIFKINMFIDSKRAGLGVSAISLISAIFSLVIGVLIIVITFINPFTLVNIYLILAGIGLIVEAVFDTVAVIVAEVEKKKLGI